MKGSHKFALRDGTVVDSLSPDQEEKIRRRMRESFWVTFYKLVPKKAEDKFRAV